MNTTEFKRRIDLLVVHSYTLMYSLKGFLMKHNKENKMKEEGSLVGNEDGEWSRG